jgi:4-hydroxyproline epimerase
VPAFLYATDLKVECSGLGTIKVDVAYGGNFYAIVDPQENFARARTFYRRPINQF